MTKDFDEFKKFASRQVVAQSGRPGTTGNRETARTKAAAKILSAESLAGIENSLEKIDLRAALRRQPVYALLPGGKDSRRVFDEIYIHIAHLRDQLKLNVDFFS